MPDAFPEARPIETLADAAAWLEGLINVERLPDLPYRRLSLEPIGRLLARLDNPQHGLSVVHVAGSKGKGSTVLLADALLGALGERVGSFTSPHLERWTERFRIAGREVDDERLAAAVARLRPHVDALRREDPAQAPTFFDATTAAAWLLFAEAGLDRVILEVGLGGRLDSTNAVDPAVTCITTIELEHTDKLGGTVAAIAAEKAGIVKPGRPLVLGALPAAAEAVVRARAEALGAPVTQLGRDFDVRLRTPAALDGLSLALRDGSFHVDAVLPALGVQQAANAALALACVRRLGAHADAALAEAVARGFANARLPGRVELVGRAPWLVVDAAHTAASATALAAALACVPRAGVHLVLSVSAGKDLPAILAALLPLAGRVTLTRAEPTRSLAPAEIAAAARAVAPESTTRVVPNPHLALRAARASADPADLVIATGSVYLAGIARRVWSEPPAPVRVSRRTATAADAGTRHPS
ncbi:MAG: Mur ligase family protein [Myxococcota bacterium]|nr:Mur ligase family protein [Myxococcota bacterium]